MERGGTNCNNNSGVTYSGLMMGFGNNTSRTGSSKAQFLSLPLMLGCGHPNLQSDHQTTDQEMMVSCSDRMKAKIMAHPLFPRLLASYVSCQKVGAPPEVVARLEQACSAAVHNSEAACLGGGDPDPALDQFMEAYCEMLTKYEEELTKPFKEAMLFLSKIDSQLQALTVHSSSDSASSDDNIVGRSGSPEEVDATKNESCIDPRAEDREIKAKLLHKYTGYLGSLKQEFMKKKKNGKLPKEARHQLLDWWSRHYKWPYPSEAQKLTLAESTGLDLKQINNWFINQRKRHWKPSEDIQFAVMDPTHPHHHPHFYMDNNLTFPMNSASTLL
ncbi:unnamed protein product [Prunus armeniaca]